MKRIILSILILLTVTSEIYSQPFPKKKYWFGCGFIYSNPQREVQFGKWHATGYEGNIYFRTVLRENLEFGVAAEYGIYTFDVEKYRKDKDFPATGETDHRADVNNGSMFSIYQDIYMNALPKFSKDLFFSFGLGYYRLVSKEGLYETFQVGEWHSVPIPGEILNSFGFNLGMNYDQKIIFNRLNIVYEVRFHQLMFSQDLQQFLKFKIGFMF